MKPLALVASIGLLLACSHSSSEEKITGPKQEFSFHSNTDAYTVTVTPTGITGAHYQVARTENGLRGTVSNQPLDVEVQGNQITGALGSQPVKLNVQPEGAITRINGLYGGVINNLEVSNQIINGRAGRCSYDLKRQQDDHYYGYSTCVGQGGQPTTVRVPGKLADHPDPQSAAELTLLLAR